MFYAHFVLAKKGPLARIWLAAHWDKKLTKAHVFETNIESSVEGILQPKVKMALRTSGHLLLGIVRIYSRKAKYLLADCNEAFIKIKMAFRPGVVDLPEGNREAAVATITLPEVFHDFDTAMPDITIDMDAQVTLNQSRAEDITLKEDYGTLSLMADDAFDDMAFDEPEAARDATNIDDGFENASLLLGEEPTKERPEETIQSNTSVASKPNVSLDAPLRDDGFGGTVGEGLLDGETGGLFEPAGLFDDAPLDNVALENTTEPTIAEPTISEPTEPIKPPEEHEDDSDDDMYDMGPASVGAPSPPTSPESPVQPLTVENPPEPEPVLPPSTASEHEIDLNPPGPSLPPPAPPTPDILPSVPEIVPPPPLPTLDHTTLINNEDESFALAPLDTTIVHGAERTVKAKRKRKLIVDEVKNISGEEMKSQLSDTTDIVTTLDLAPPTKRLMHWKETGGVEKLFALPGHEILSKTLSRAYQRHLTTRSVDNEDFGAEEDRIDLDVDLEQPRDEPPEISVPQSRKRPRRDPDPIYPQDLSHLDPLHLDASRPSYASDHSLTHPSLDVPNFLQPPFSQPPMMPNVLQHPPPAHVIQHMLQQDVNQLSHLPDMMHHTMVDQGPPLHSMASNMHNVPSPVVSDAFNQRIVHPGMDSVPEHLLADPVPDHLQQPSMDKTLPSHSPLANTMNQQSLQDQLTQPNTVGNLPIMENHLHPCAENDIMQSHMDGHVLQPPVDEDVTQPCLAEDYAHAVPPLVEDANALAATIPNMLSNSEHNNLPVVNDHLNDTVTQNCSIPQNDVNQQSMTQQPTTQPMTQQEAEANALFDSLNNGDIHNNLQTQNLEIQNNDINQNDTNALQKNDFSMSDEDDDYGAPASVGPILPEEQMADETYEQFEERILTKRTVHMLHIINSKLDRDNQVSFSDVIRNNKRKQVAQKFYTFLVLKKQHAVELEQNSSYGDLIITRGPKFSAVYNSA